MVDPNIVYLVLVFGAWSAVTAAYVPGTGVPEVFALVGLGGGIWLLTSLPTNWVALVVLFIGVLSFLLIPFLNRRLARIAEAGLILQLVGALTLFNGVQVSWVLIAVTIVLSVTYHHAILLPLLEKSWDKSSVINDDQVLVGSSGRVIKASERLGPNYMTSVNVHGETWSAYGDHPLKLGDEVIVLKRDGLQLVVEGVKHKSSSNKGTEEKE